MIIDKDGNMMSAVLLQYGIIVEDIQPDITFHIFLPYENEDDIARKAEILSCKESLTNTDYKTQKYIEGQLTDEEWATVKAQRQAWRDRINELEALITNPTITDDEIKAAEDAARKKMTNDQTNS